MNLSARIIAYLWLTKEKIKAAWIKRRANRAADRLARHVQRHTPAQPS